MGLKIRLLKEQVSWKWWMILLMGIIGGVGIYALLFPKLVPRVVPQPYFAIHPTRASIQLLNRLNQRLAKIQMLDLLVRSVKIQTRKFHEKSFPHYQEEFRLPRSWTVVRLVRQLNQVAQALGAHASSIRREVISARRTTRYWVSFEYASNMIPIQLIFRKNHQPEICLIIDDAGYQAGSNLAMIERFHVPVTVAIIPGTPFSTYLAQVLPLQGIQVICHMPMQGIDPVPTGAYAYYIHRGMTAHQIRYELIQGIQAVPNCVGLNNHMGSVITSDANAMRIICQVLKSRHLFYIDSLTSPNSVGKKIARQMHVLCARRDVFLDDVRKPAYIQHQFQLLVQESESQGRAVGIAHFHWIVLNELRKLIHQTVRKSNIQFVYASEIVK